MDSSIKPKLRLKKNYKKNPRITKSIVYELGIETAKILNERQDDLRNICWTNGEANIDTEYSKLACECCTIAWEIIQQKYPEDTKADISCSTPDIKIVFTYLDKKISKEKIELKSFKDKTMLGSTIGRLDINQTLIYCLRPKEGDKNGLFKLKCSQYHSAMGETDIDRFQDRKPRPNINFDKMSEISNTLPFIFREKSCWISHYAKCGLNRIKDPSKKSWQDTMIRMIKKQIIDDYITNTSEDEFQVDKITLELENTKID
tara:strand:+ start:142 stop:921 length:780 start_codon:yes stop_codon:yes gene_type:complete